MRCGIAPTKESQGFDQQAVLALKMQVDDTLAQPRFAGNGRHGGIRQAIARHRANGRLDQLMLPLLFGGRPLEPITALFN